MICRSVRGLIHLAHISHFLAIMFQQSIINSRASFRANSENWRRWLDWRSVGGLVCLFHMNVMLAHICLPPFYLNRLESTHGFHSERTRSTDVVDYIVSPYVNWCVLFVLLLRWLTFPCHSIWTEANDLTGNLDPIFCDGSFFNWTSFDSDCNSSLDSDCLPKVMCSCCTDCYWCGQADLQCHQQRGLYFKKTRPTCYIITNSNWLFPILVINAW